MRVEAEDVRGPVFVDTGSGEVTVRRCDGKVKVPKNFFDEKKAKKPKRSSRLKKPKKKSKQLSFETEWTKDRIKENDEINRIRLEKEKGSILLKGIIQHMETGIMVADDSGRMEVVNDAALSALGVSQLEFLSDLDQKQEIFSVVFPDPPHGLEQHPGPVLQASPVFVLSPVIIG